MYSAPVFVYLASFAFGLERPTLFKWAAIATVMLGVILLTGIHDVGASDITLVAVGAGLLSGLSYATFIFAFKYAAPHGSPQAILVIAFVVLVGILASMSDAQQAAALPGAGIPRCLRRRIAGQGEHVGIPTFIARYPLL